MSPLTGETLLKAIRGASDKATNLDLIRECGYTITNTDGSEELLIDAFYDALVLANGGEMESEESEEDDGSNDLPEDWIYLLGGRAEVEKTIEYGGLVKSRTLDRLNDADDDRTCIVALAELRRQYEKDTKRQPLDTNPEVHGIRPFTIVDHGISINIVTGDDNSSNVLFAYTVGHEFSELLLPELLIFSNSVSIIDQLLNGLSTAMLIGELEIRSGEVIEVVKELDQGGVIAARLQVLDGKVLELCQDHYACAVCPGYPIVNIDIADEDGLFPGDNGFDSDGGIERPEFIPIPKSPSRYLVLSGDKSIKIECITDAGEPENIVLSIARTEDSEFRPIPDLFSFYPSAKTILIVFTAVRKLLESGKLSIEPECVFEIVGILGLLGEVPIRLRLLSDDQLELVSERFNLAKDSRKSSILVDIPDVCGRFAWEKGAEDYVVKSYDHAFYPIGTATPARCVIDNDFPMPSSSTSLYDCLSCYIGFLENPQCDEDDEEAGLPPTLATMRVLLNLLHELHPDTWDYDGSQEEIEKAHIAFCRDICKTYLVPKLALEWVENERLNEYDATSPDPYEADIWRLPPPLEIPLPIADQFPSVNEWGDCYPDIATFIKDVDWVHVKRVLAAAYEDSIDPDEVELCRRIQAGRG